MYLQNEINILRMINHPNIIKFYFLMKKPDFTYLGIEYCNGGSLMNNLYEYINKYNKPFSEKLVQKLMKQILLGVKYLHDRGIIHRDLKLNNILIHYDNDYDLKNQNLYSATIKIIDFNISYMPNGNMPLTVVGTSPNMAPSVVQNIYNIPKPYDDKVDIWSLGTLCYEMLFGKRLFTGIKREEIYQNILTNNFKIPKTISIQARSFILNMLRKEGINRLSASQLLNHDFIILNYHNFNMYYKEKVNNNNNIPLIKKNNNNNHNNIIPFVNGNNNNNHNHNNNIPFVNGINNNNHNHNKIIFKKENKKMLNKNNFIPVIQEKCNGCGDQTFHSILYKCMECADVVYCEICFNKFRNTHIHPFQKIKKILIKQINVDIPRNALSPKIIRNKKLQIRSPSDNNFYKKNQSPQKIYHNQTFQNINNYNISF